MFKLAPALSACKTALCPWTETVLYRFTGGKDGANPPYGDLVFDQAGNAYGTTFNGGSYSVGNVYELTPSNGGWEQSVLYAFNNSGNDGIRPFSGVVFDKVGNLYGTTSAWGGGNRYGTVFQLTPSGSGWTESILYAFQGLNDGQAPEGGVIFDPSGNIYGTTSGGPGGGTVFELTPSGGGWTFSLIHTFAAGIGPLSSLARDAAGNLYGTAFTSGAKGYGSVFKLTYSGGIWTYTTLHDFTGGTDGGNPIGNVIVDASGNVYGTASSVSMGGPYGPGVVFEIAP